MTLKDIQSKLSQRLVESGWNGKLKMFILSMEFQSILAQLLRESQEGKKFTPIVKNLFRPFEECAYKDLKIVFVGHTPYPELNYADGLAFSCQPNAEQPEHLTLQYIFNEIAHTVYQEHLGGVTQVYRKDYNPDLSRWAKQGILLLNPTLTCQIENADAHIDLWKPFDDYIFDILNTNYTGIAYVFIGKQAREWHHKIDGKNNYKFFTTHPLSTRYTKQDRWNSGDLFNQLNNLMFKLYGEKILW